MRANLEIVQQWLGLSEGGYVNNRKDPGGPTNKGVTQRVFSDWLRSRGQMNRDVRTITKAEAERIFKDQYFAPVRFDDLPPGLDYAVADYSVNSGPMRAAKDLQRTLRASGHDVTVDGHIGVNTLAAVNDTQDLPALITNYVNRRWSFMNRLGHFKTFEGGWRRRLFGAIAGQQDDDTGVLDRAERMARHIDATSIPAPKQQENAKSTEGSMRVIPAIIEFLIRLFTRNG